MVGQHEKEMLQIRIEKGENKESFSKRVKMKN
jgi:hypothetical protein